MSSLPTRTDISGSPSKATAQAAFTALFDFIAQRLAAGTSGAGTASAAELKTARDSLGLSAVVGRNLLINPAFQINQDAYVSGAAVGADLYGHDGWKMAGAADTYTFSTTANVTTVTIPSGKVLQQVVDGTRLQSGACTLSWQGTAQGKIGAGSYGSSGITGTLTGGTDVTIEFGPGTLIGPPKLEYGEVPTASVLPDPLDELARCKEQYYIVDSASYTGYAYLAGSIDGMRSVLPHPVRMRAAPTVVITAASYGGTNSLLAVTASAETLQINLKSTAGNTNVFCTFSLTLSARP